MSWRWWVLIGVWIWDVAMIGACVVLLRRNARIKRGIDELDVRLDELEKRIKEWRAKL